MIVGFLHKWRHRADFLAREAAYQGRGLASLLAAVAFVPEDGAPLLVLVATPAQGRFLAWILPWICRCPAEAQVIGDLATLEASLAKLRERPRRVLLAGELYARFHAQLAPEVLAGTLSVA
jgi:hypothetical protein